MEIYVISLSESVQRRSNIVQSLKEHNISFNFHIVERLTPSEIEHFYPKQNTEKTIRYKGYKLTNAEIGCFISHIQLWQKCIELDKPIFIFEDNFKIDVPDFNSTIKLLYKNLSYFGFVKLSKIFDRKIKSSTNLTKKYQIVSYSRGTCGTQGYGITPKAASILLNNSKNFFEPVDDFIETEWRNNLVIYGIEPPIISRDTVKSTIGVRKSKLSLPFLKFSNELYRLNKQIRQLIFNFKHK